MLSTGGKTVRQRDNGRPVRCGMVTEDGPCGRPVVFVDRQVAWAGKIEVLRVALCPHCEGTAIRQLAEAGRKVTAQEAV